MHKKIDIDFVEKVKKDFEELQKLPKAIYVLPNEFFIASSFNIDAMTLAAVFGDLSFVISRKVYDAIVKDLKENHIEVEIKSGTVIDHLHGLPIKFLDTLKMPAG